LFFLKGLYIGVHANNIVQYVTHEKQ